MKIIKPEKIILSFLIAAILILNIASPVAAAIISSNYNGEGLPTCNLFCNLSVMADDTAKKDIPCPLHSKEAKKKKLSDLFQCKIVPMNCHDTPTTQAGTQIDPYLLSKYTFDDNLTIFSLSEEKTIIPSQIYDFSLEKPPTILS